MKIPPTLLASLLLVGLLTYSASATETIRQFTAEVSAVDPAGSITFVHPPSGYKLTARVSEKADLKRNRFFSPGEIPEGKTIRIDVGGVTIDEKAHTVTARECTVEPIEEKNLKIREDRQRICGTLLRVPSEPVVNATLKVAGGSWTTPDGKTPLAIQTADGQRWMLRWFMVTPLAHQIEPGTAQDFQIGNTAGILVADHGNGQGELKGGWVNVWFAGAEKRDALGRCPVSLPSGITVAQVEAKMETNRKNYAVMKEALAKQMPVSMRVEPELALVGESVQLHFRVLAAKQPNAKVILFPDYFHTLKKDRKELEIPWKQDGASDGLNVYTASVTLPSATVGQYLVQWRSDVGGDIDEYSRSYAICDNQTAVCLFLICGGDAPKQQCHQNNIPFDFWTHNALHLALGLGKTPDGWSGHSRDARQFGDVPNFAVTPDTGTEPAEIQRLGVRLSKELAPMMGYPEGPVAVWSYTMGNAGYRAIQAQGGMTATTLCTENHVDGGMEINCWGKPERPYFMSSEDFRKPGSGGPNGTVAFSQLQRHTELAQHYLCDYCGEAASLGGELLCATGQGNTFDELAFSRMLDAYDALLRMAQCQKSPYFVAESIQMNGARPGATEGNRIVLDYAMEKAKTGKVVFANSRGVTQFYQRHYTTTPESTSYFDDYWAGTHVKNKPDLFPDTMTMEGGTLYALALSGQIIPETVYDYTTKWDFPDFGNDQIPRRFPDPGCYMLPGKYDKFEATPKLLDTRPFQATRQDATDSGSLVVTVSVDAQKAQKNLPLALWNLPRAFQRGDGWFHASENCRFVPIVAPYTGNLNGFLVADVAIGHNVFKLRVDSPVRTAQTMEFEISGSLRGKIFDRDGKKMAYIWPSGPWPATLRLHLPEGKSAQIYVAPEGGLRECKPGETTVEVPQGQWLRLVGLEREEIIRYVTAEHP